MIRTKALAILTVFALAAPASMMLRAATIGSDYEVLSRKDIFSKNRISARLDDGNRSRNQRRTKRVRTYTPVLIGVMLEDDGYVAFIVDPASHDITSARAGDPLPSNAGTLKDVTLDYIITDPGNGKPLTRVTMGQNILGGVAEYPDPNADPNADDSDSTTQPATGGATDNAGGNTLQPSPPAGPAAPAPGGGNVQDIAARLRAKRLQQLGK